MSLETPLNLWTLPRQLCGKAKTARSWALPRSQSESRMREIRTSGSMSGERKRSVCQSAPSHRASPRLYTPVRAGQSGLWLWIPGSGFAGPGMTGTSEVNS
jgi:hypothetical protein